MKEKTVIIEIDEQGNSTIDLDGFHGKGCADVAKDFQGRVETISHCRVDALFEHRARDAQA